MDIIKEFWEFMKERRKFWLIPIILMLGLLAAAVFQKMRQRKHHCHE